MLPQFVDGEQTGRASRAHPGSLSSAAENAMSIITTVAEGEKKTVLVVDDASGQYPRGERDPP